MILDSTLELLEYIQVVLESPQEYTNDERQNIIDDIEDVLKKSRYHMAGEI
jgi:hypothetical protein